MHLRARLLIILAFFICQQGIAQRTTQFYVVAHQDDWQLFMGLDAYNFVNNDTNHHMVVIHTTAGDGSCNKKALDIKYYKARERGAIGSLEFCADAVTNHTRDFIDTVVINGHNIRKFTYKNVANYFLRLPDGCGSTGLHGESLEWLQRGFIPSIMAVDSTAVYYGWKDLVETLRQIMILESGDCAVTGLNIADTSSVNNPGDHPDHTNSAKAAMAAAANIDNMWQRCYVEYYAAKLPVNITPQEIAIKGAIYGVAEFSRQQSDVYCSWNAGHIEFLCRNYYRTVPSRIDRLLHTPTPPDAVIYPNPAADFVNVIYHVTTPGAVQITVRNINGIQVINPVILQKEKGDFSTRVDIPLLSSGNYLLTLQTQDFQQTFTFVKS